MKKKQGAVMHKLKKGMLALLLAGSMGVMAACGGEDGRVDAVKEWVYVPEFVDMKDADIRYYNVWCSGENLYYTSSEYDEGTDKYTEYLERYSLADGTSSSIKLDWGDEQQENSNLDEMSIGADGSICAMVRSYTFDETTHMGTSTNGLVKFDADGKLAFFLQDVSDKFGSGSRDDYVYINGIAQDQMGRIYLAGESAVVLFEADGTCKGAVSVGNGMDGRIRSIGADSDGKVYVCNYNYNGGGTGYELMDIDFDGQTTGAVYADFPGGSMEGLTPGAEPGTFIVSDGSTVYEYSLATQAKTALFDWLDSDIDGTYVNNIGMMADGRVVAVIHDWENDDNSGVTYLTKTKGSEVVQKETVLIGTLGISSELQAAAVNFNRNSDKYHVTFKEYMNNTRMSTMEEYQAAYQDAFTNLNNDLTSRANCPDIIAMDSLNVAQLVSKGLLEDLGKYLDKSDSLKREDIVDNILRSYTYDGVLVCIPKSFELSTIIGKTSEVGEKQGWTLQEFIAYADQHPNALLFDNVTKSEIMYYLMAYNEDSFIDWSKGKCDFDNEEFKNLLAFVNRFPSEIANESYHISTPTKIQRGEVLLDTASLYDFNEIQMYYEIFGGDYTCKGLPAQDGSIGTILASNGLYGITTKATRKEGAWEFLEYYLQQDSRYSYGFPSRKAKLDEMAKEAVTIQYWTNDDGSPVLDENGEPIEVGVGGSIGYGDGWSYTYRRATQEEVDLIMQLIDQAKPVSLGITQVMDIINEETAGYFEGQKTVDEVAKVIQNRIQLYVDVNN